MIAALDARPVAVPTGRPFEWFVAERDDHRVVVALNGVDRRHGVDLVGTEPAVLNTGAVLDAFAPDLVVSAGTAG